MAARVSVSSAGAARGSANRAGEESAGRTATPAAPVSGFSSVLNAAAAKPGASSDGNARSRDDASAHCPANQTDVTRGGSGTHADDTHADAKSARAESTPDSAAQCQGAAPQTASRKPAESNANGAGPTQATSNGAASTAQTDAASTDGQAPTQGSASADNDGKTRTTPGDGSDAVATDPATLALLLAATGAAVNAPIGSDSHSAGSQDDTQTGDGAASTDATAATAAAGALAATVALSALAAPATTTQPGPAASQYQLADTSVGDPTSGGRSASGSLRQAMFVAFDPTKAGNISNDFTGAASVPGQGTADAFAQAAPSASSTQPSAYAGAAGNAMPDVLQQMAAASQSPAVERSIAVPVSDHAWPNEIAAQVQWMVGSHVQSATLQLSPAHLGPLEVHIDVQSSQVNVSFSASHPDTRSALEQSVPRLRELMAGSGLTLGQTSVQQQAGSGSQYTPSSSRRAIAASQTVNGVSLSPLRALGLIDEYA